MNEPIDAGMDQKAEKMWMTAAVPCSFGPISDNDDDLKRWWGWGLMIETRAQSWLLQAVFGPGYDDDDDV